MSPPAAEETIQGLQKSGPRPQVISGVDILSMVISMADTSLETEMSGNTCLGRTHSWLRMAAKMIGTDALMNASALRKTVEIYSCGSVSTGTDAVEASCVSR